MSEENKSEILKRLGVGFHVLGLIISIMTLVIVIFLATPILLIYVPFYLIGGWGLRWILTGENTNIIPFYEKIKNAFKNNALSKQTKRNITNVFYILIVSNILIMLLVLALNMPLLFLLYFFLYWLYLKQVG